MGSFTDPLCVLINVLGIFADLVRVLVSVLLYKCLSETLDRPRGRVDCTHLVIRHGCIQISDETVQGFGMIGVFQEFHDPMLLGKRFELRNYPSQLPANSERETRRLGRRGVSPTF